ncbi:MAG: sensor histidine kinase KdpD [Rhodospirillaceae bacterium]|nr:sensor histidine kinase KdpD [Rhodospirillaceae bacterium]
MAATPDPSNRPSADALLDTAQREQQGRLKVFLGAAPGVGKTYEMLLAGRKRRAEGIDVVIGVVETHGRAETEALIEGAEIVPRKMVSYRGRELPEMDIDAILARKPQLVLVDELAHTNAEGSRHTKRYQDVEELLEHGIDVFSTLNIQHLESLNDVVAQITHVRVRETLPDRIIDRADEVELIDLTPKDLIQRLKEGKVYMRDAADRALQHYFSEGNLTALRELALRRTAQRVDDQMLNYMQAHAIAGPWAAGERVLVCIDEHPASFGLVRYAKRAADRMQARWTAIYVETVRYHHLSEKERDRVAEALRLAERLGGDAVTLPGNQIASDLIDFSRANNITQIIIGKSTRSRLFELMHGSVVRDLVRASGDIGIHVVPGTPSKEDSPTRDVAEAASTISLAPFVGSAVTVGFALIASLTIDRFIDLPNISMMFLAAVLFSAVQYGLFPSLFASILSTLAYNYFFLEPIHTFTVADPSNVIALFFFLMVAILTSNLTARVRAEAQASRQRAASTAALYNFSRKVAAIGEMDDLLWAVAHQIALMLRVHVILLLPDDRGGGKEDISVRIGYPPDDELNEADLAAARWAWDHGKPAGRGAGTLPGAKRLFIPLATERGKIGVMGLDREEAGPMFTPDQKRLLDALCDQAAVAIERISLMQDIDKARVVSETEQLRTALLNSISHDFRTPLASIIGSVSSLRSLWHRFPEETREELLRTTQEEAERLNRFIGNILDMTRLEAGALAPRLQPADLGEIAANAISQAKQILSQHIVKLDIPENLPMLLIDATLTGQILMNMLDNAAKYAPPGSEIRVSIAEDREAISLTVRDEGPGIPPGDLERIFDRFFRVEGGDRRRAGTGLGLAICRGFAEAMSADISATNRTDHSGALFTVRFPARLKTAP